MKREKFCIVCYMPFYAVRRDAKYCDDACRQKACRDKKTSNDSYILPKYVRYKVVYFADPFTLNINISNHKRREWIDSEIDLDRVKDSIKQYDSVLFICYKRTYISKVIEIINQ